MSTIGIIGSGNIGGALTRLFTKAGHTVRVANSRGPDTLRALAAETGAQAATVEDAVQGADIVVVTIPLNRVPDLPKGLFADAPDDLIVIDTCNYYPRQRDGAIAAIEGGQTESAWVESQIGHPVIKVFNTIYAAHLQNDGRPRGEPGRIALPVAGDDAKAKATVRALVDEIGFDTVDDGTIADCWRQQPGSPCYTKDFDAAALRQALSDAKQDRTADWRATPNSPGDFENPA